MRLKTLGGLSVEGSAFTRPVPLLLLAYVRLRGGESRQHLANTFFIDKADAGDSVSVALRQLERGLGTGVVDRNGDPVECQLVCDLEELSEAHASGDLERVCSLYTGPFLARLEDSRYIRSEEWSEELTSWVHRERQKVAGKVFSAGVRLAAGRLGVGLRNEAGEYLDLALTVFIERFEHDEYTAEHSAFDARDLVTAHALLAALGSDSLAEFVELVSAYDHVHLPVTAEAASALLEGGDGGVSQPQGELVGRVQERAAIGAALAADPKGYVTLHGAGGYGKTTLAHHVAHERLRAGHYPDGVFFVSLEDLRFANLIPVRLAESLGIDLNPAHDALEQVRNRLRRSKALIVLDNFDHVIERADVPETIVASCAGVDVIVTSRERLGTSHERVVPLGGLGVPGDGLTPDAIAESDAVRLFLVRSAADLGDVGEEDLRRVGSICRLADGSPLVIDLAASLTQVIPVADLEQLLERGSTAIEGTRAELPERHRSVRAVWGYSWRLLEDDERAALGRLSCFPDSFDWKAAQAVAQVNAQQLQQFVNRSQLRVSDRQRFSFHPLLAAFVREAIENEDFCDVRVRHQDYYLGRARTLAALANTGEARTAMQELDAESSNLRAAWEWTTDVGTLREFVAILEPYQVRRGRWLERLELIARTRDALAGTGSDEGLPELLNAAADVHLQQGQIEQADRALQRSLALQRSGQRTPLTAETLSQLGGVHYMRRELDEAAECFEASRHIHAELGDTASELNEVGNLAAVKYLKGEYGEGLRLWKFALARHRRAENLEQQAQVLNNLGAAYQVMGRLEEALVHFEKAQALYNRVGDSMNVLVAKGNIGGVLFQRGDFAESRSLYGAILTEHRRTGNVEAGALILNNLAMIDEREGNLAGAHELLLAALADQDAIDDRLNRTATLHNLSTVALQLGRQERAMALARQSIELAEETSNDAAKAYALLFLGDALVASGEFERAAEALDEAQGLFEAGSDVAGGVQALISQSVLALALNDVEVALRLAVAASAVAAEHDMRPLLARAESVRSRAL